MVSNSFCVTETATNVFWVFMNFIRFLSIAGGYDVSNECRRSMCTVYETVCIDIIDSIERHSNYL